MVVLLCTHEVVSINDVKAPCGYSVAYYFPDNGASEERRHRRDLKLYYGMDNGETETVSHIMPQSSDPCNLDGASFQPQLYLSKLIQVCLAVTTISFLCLSFLTIVNIAF